MAQDVHAVSLEAYRAMSIKVISEVARLRTGNTELAAALKHCVNALKEYERDDGKDLRPFLLGALDAARTALAKMEQGDG